MTLIVFATICLLAFVFLLFVLYQWIRETKHEKTTGPAVKEAETHETKRLHNVGAWRVAERRNHSKVRSHRVARTTEGPIDREIRCKECERIVYERIARSFEPGRETRREECAF
jgi:hypothetical protein